MALAALLAVAAPASADEPAAPPQPAAPAAEAPAPTEPQPAAPATQPQLQPEPAGWRDLGPQVFDAAVLRPFGAATSLAGLGVFALAAPLAWYSEGVGQLWDILVMEPVDFTFERPLGDF